MKTYQQIHLRRFDVRIRDNRTGEEHEDVIVLSKDMLQAAQLCGQSSRELIYQAYNRECFAVLDIGRANKATAALDLLGLFEVAD